MKYRSIMPCLQIFFLKMYLYVIPRHPLWKSQVKITQWPTFHGRLDRIPLEMVFHFGSCFLSLAFSLPVQIGRDCSTKSLQIWLKWIKLFIGHVIFSQFSSGMAVQQKYWASIGALILLFLKHFQFWKKVRSWKTSFFKKVSSIFFRSFSEKKIEIFFSKVHYEQHFFEEK